MAGVEKRDVASKIAIGLLRNMLDEMEETLINSHVYVDKVLKIAESNGEKELVDALRYTQVSIASIRRQEEEIRNYFKEIRLNYRVNDEELKSKIELIGKYKEALRETKVRCEQAENDRELLKRENNSLKNMLSEIENGTAREIKTANEEYINNELKVMRELIDLVRNNVEALSTSEFMRSDVNKQVGEKSPLYKKDINTDELIEMYIKSGYKLTDEVVNYFNSKATISYNGLMERLKKQGVWRGRE